MTMIVFSRVMSDEHFSFRDRLCKRDRQSIGIDTDGESDALIFAIGGWHHKVNPALLQSHVACVKVGDIKPDRAGAGILAFVVSASCSLADYAAAVQGKRRRSGHEFRPAR